MMTTSIAALRIGPVEHRVLQALDRSRRRVWRWPEAGLPGITRPQLRQALHYLERAGMVERIERGSYLVLPRSGRILVSPIELVGSWFEDEPHAIVGHAAAEYHGLTLDTASVVQVHLARAKQPVEFQGVRYVFSKAAKTSLLTDNNRVRFGHAMASVASPGKTLVLLLDQTPARRSTRPVRDTRLALDVLEAGLAKGVWAKVDWVRLVKRHGSSATARRLGYLLERTRVPGADALHSLRGVSGNISFSPVYPHEGPVTTRWGLILNDPLVI